MDGIAQFGGGAARLVLSQIQFNKEQENVGEQRKKATALL